MNILVALPHYFNEVKQSNYGSGREGQKQARSLALIQCLSSLLALRREEHDLILNIAKRGIERTQKSKSKTLLDIHLFTDGEHVLNPVLAIFEKAINVHTMNLENSRELPLKARDYLINQGHAYDLCLYLEDDLIIRDTEFLKKQHWLIHKSAHKAVLMPHRTEWVPKAKGQRLIVDGPLRPDFIQRFCKPKLAVARGIYQGQREVVFDQTDNPHSGLFCISGQQAGELAKIAQPNDGFISPLETAATLTVLQRYVVLKPSWNDRYFLWVEHGHPSFQGYSKSWPMVGDPV